MNAPPVQRVRNSIAFLVCLSLNVSSARTIQAEITLDELRDREAEVRRVVEAALPATVCVRSAKGGGSGSGVIVSADGLVLTAAHVTNAVGKDLVCVFRDGRQVKAKSLGLDRGRDAGMVQITEKGEYPFVEVGKSSTLKKNQWCVSLGHPGGFNLQRGLPLRWGRVLANHQWVVTNCTLIGGDSGGPLFDLSGRVIGIHSNIGSALTQNQHVPIDVFHTGWKRMLDGDDWGKLPANPQRIKRPILGLRLSPEATEGGVRVDGVLPGSPAERAGVKVGDLLTKFEDEAVVSAQEFLKRLGKMSADQEVSFEVTRNEEVLELSTRLMTLKNYQKQRKELAAAGSGPAPPPLPEPGSVKSRLRRRKPSRPPRATSRLQSLLDRAKENGGRIRLTPDQLKQLRGRLNRRMSRTAPVASSGQMQDPFSKDLRKAYAPITTSPSQSTLRVFVEERNVALATVVHRDGLLVTKASEVADKEFTIEVGKEDRVDGEIVDMFKAHDLALVKIPVDTLAALEWNVADDLNAGTFCASIGPTAEPTAVGVVSVRPRSLQGGSFLGVQPAKHELGLLLRSVKPGSPAAMAGLRVGDIILSLDGENFRDPQAFGDAIRDKDEDDRIRLAVKRDDLELAFQIKLKDRSNVAQMSGARQQAMDSMSTRLSRRRGGFAAALQHDCPIRPQDCGGALVDLEGRLLGINVARAGRIKSFAIPAPAIRKLLATSEHFPNP